MLEGKDVKDNIVKMIDDTIAHAVHAAVGEHSLIIEPEMVEQARRPFIGVFLRPEDCTFTPEECDDLTADQLTNILSDQAHKRLRSQGAGPRARLSCVSWSALYCSRT